MSPHGNSPLDAEECLYNRNYYLTDCEGYQKFIRSRGRLLSKRLAKCVDLLELKPGERFVDVGCGRGEIALHAAARGIEVTAVDSSADALELLDEAQRAWQASDLHGGDSIGAMRVINASICQLPIETGYADAVLMSDVIEHIPRHHILSAMHQLHRILRPGGRIVLHTQPNRWLVDYTVPIFSRYSWIWGIRLPHDLREEMTAGSRGDYHPSEQSRRELTRWLNRAGFRIDDVWLEGTYPLHRIFGNVWFKHWLLPAFRKNRLLKDFLASQIFAIARK